MKSIGDKETVREVRDKIKVLKTFYNFQSTFCLLQVTPGQIYSCSIYLSGTDRKGESERETRTKETQGK